MGEILSILNSNGAYATGPHAHREFMLLVPERGMRPHRAALHRRGQQLVHDAD